MTVVKVVINIKQINIKTSLNTAYSIGFLSIIIYYLSIFYSSTKVCVYTTPQSNDLYQNALRIELKIVRYTCPRVPYQKWTSL